MGAELLDFGLDSLHGGLDRRFPDLERSRRQFQRIQALILLPFRICESLLPLRLLISQSPINVSFVVGKFLANLLEKQLGIRIHGSQLPLRPRVVDARRWIQSRANHHELLRNCVGKHLWPRRIALTTRIYHHKAERRRGELRLGS
jgi:hypothetical protein